MQIGSVIKAVHNSGLAVRALDPNRVLVTGKHRVRLAGCAVLDVLQWDGGAQIAGHQVSLSTPAALAGHYSWLQLSLR